MALLLLMVGACHLWGLLLVRVFRIELQEDWDDYRSPADMYIHLLVRLRWLVVGIAFVALVGLVTGA
jgi:hypothetical protein